MVTQIISANRSTGVLVGFADVVYLDPAATITIASGTGAAIGSANITAFDTTLLLAGDVVNLGTGAGINLLGTTTGLSTGTGSHDITMTEGARILVRGTCITTQGGNNRFYLDGNLTGDAGVRNTGSNAIVQHTGTMAMAGDGMDLNGTGNRAWNSGLIEAGQRGIDIIGDFTVINNLGTVKAGNVALAASGNNMNIHNAGSLLASNGIEARGDGATIVNSGDIAVRNIAILFVGAEGSLIPVRIVNSGDLAANGGGIHASRSNLTVINTGSILAGSSGANIDGTQLAVLINSGDIAGFDGATVTADGSVRLQNSGRITGGADGAFLSGVALVAANAATGSIEGERALRSSGGTLRLANLGSLTGTDTGVDANSETTLANHGQIVGGTTGVNILTRADNDGTSHRVTNSGRIAGDGAITAELQIGNSTGHLQITNTGAIVGDSAGVTAINLAMTLWNSGQITATGVAVSAQFQTRIENHGLIASGEAGNDGAAILLDFGRDVVRNFGTISGAVVTGALEDLVLNRGLITGDVRLGDGDDRYIGKAGRIEGVIDGGAGNDTIHSGEEDDILRGGDGNDLIIGRGGDDTITGGGGRDSIVLGGGADDFVLLAAADSTTASPDFISDFTAGTDDIDLRALGAGGSFIGASAFSGVARQVRYIASTGLVQGDVNGDLVADWAIQLGNKPALTAGDFLF